jgi:hypothetical protein
MSVPLCVPCYSLSCADRLASRWPSANCCVLGKISVETAGHFDRDAELKMWLAGAPALLQLQFNRKLNIYEVQAVLASYVTK